MRLAPSGADGTHPSINDDLVPDAPTGDTSAAEVIMGDPINQSLLGAYTRASNMWAVYQTTNNRHRCRPRET